MGQAKQRGNFEQRIEQAREHFEADIEVRKRELEELDKLERRQLDAMGNFLNQRILPAMERQYGPLMRIDFNNIELKVTAEALANQNKTL